MTQNDSTNNLDYVLQSYIDITSEFKAAQKNLNMYGPLRSEYLDALRTFLIPKDPKLKDASIEDLLKQGAKYPSFDEHREVDMGMISGHTILEAYSSTIKTIKGVQEKINALYNDPKHKDNYSLTICKDDFEAIATICDKLLNK